ncbi:MAG TPA: DUF1573 domain-containing protein [Segetibacter sp.]|jgi:hypothetical protein
MKTLVVITTFFIATIAAITACSTNDSTKVTGKDSTIIADTANYTTIQWIDSVKQIGLLEKGTVAEIKFAFKNTGEKPLFIISAQPGCGCTVADYPKNAISPDGEGIITANYDTKKVSIGEFRKSVTVTTNTKNGSSHYIFFHGQVVNKGDSLLKKQALTDTTKLTAR